MLRHTHFFGEFALDRSERRWAEASKPQKNSDKKQSGSIKNRKGSMNIHLYAGVLASIHPRKAMSNMRVFAIVFVVGMVSLATCAHPSVDGSDAELADSPTEQAIDTLEAHLQDDNDDRRVFHTLGRGRSSSSRSRSSKSSKSKSKSKSKSGGTVVIIVVIVVVRVCLQARLLLSACCPFPDGNDDQSALVLAPHSFVLIIIAVAVFVYLQRKRAEAGTS